MNDKLEICKKTREIAATSLYKTLEKVLNTRKKISESEFRDLWLSELRKQKSIFLDGWYISPPHGIGVLFATDKNPQRISHKSLRPKLSWPRNNIFLNTKNGIALFYASPVDKKTGIIGDFGMTIYFGKNAAIINHMKKCLEITKKTFSYIKNKMTLSEIAEYTNQLLLLNHVENGVTSSTDPTGFNSGHTIPATEQSWSEIEQKILFSNKSTWEEKCKVISEKRNFVNSSQKLKIKPGLAFTIEPRPIVKENPNIPMVLFHSIVLVKTNGKKELLTDFDDIFRLTNMDYMLQ